MMLSLRKTASTDLDTILRIEQQFSDFVGQWTKNEHEATLDTPSAAHLVLMGEDKILLGYAILRGLNQPSRSIELMRIAIDHPGKGYGKQALALILNWCFENQKAHRVWLDVRANNTRAQRVYQAMGFMQEGILRDAVYHHGRYESLIVMSMLEDEYQQRFGFDESKKRCQT